MTKDEVLGMVRDSLDDVPGVHWTEDDVQDAFDDCMQLVSLMTRYVELGTTFATTARRGTYNLSVAIPGFYRVLAIYNQTTKLWLTPVPFKEIKVDYRWRIHQANSCEFAVLGYSHIMISPIPSNVQTLYIFYNGVQGDVVGSDSVPFSSRHHLEVVDYIIGDLLQQDLEFSNSFAHMRRFFDEIENLRIEVANRPWGDRIITLAQQYFSNVASIG